MSKAKWHPGKCFEEKYSRISISDWSCCLERWGSGIWAGIWSKWGEEEQPYRSLRGSDFLTVNHRNALGCCTEMALRQVQFQWGRSREECFEIIWEKPISQSQQSYRRVFSMMYYPSSTVGWCVQSCPCDKQNGSWRQTLHASLGCEFDIVALRFPRLKTGKWWLASLKLIFWLLLGYGVCLCYLEIFYTEKKFTCVILLIIVKSYVLLPIIM